METLEKVLNRVRSDRLEIGFFYLPNNGGWTLNSPCLILDEATLSATEKNAFGYPLIALREDLGSTFATWFVHEIIERAVDLERPLRNKTLLEALVYYYEYDDFLPEIGAPPPVEERVDEDLIFYNSLGPERDEVICRNASCKRGAVTSSLYCKLHHFEMVLKRACNYDH